MVNKERELEYANNMKAKSKAFKTFVRGIQNENTKSYYVYCLRADIMKFAYSEKIISGSEEYDELAQLDTEQITDFLEDWVEYKKEQGVKGTTISTKIASAAIY